MNIDKAEYQLITELVERIDEFRVKNNYSIYQLANKADTSINTIKHLYKKKSFPNVRYTVQFLCDNIFGDKALHHTIKESKRCQ